MPIKCVLDTNIILSAAISENGYPARIFDAVLDKEIKMYLTEDIIANIKTFYQGIILAFPMKKSAE